MSKADLNKVPHLITSLQGPLQQIERHLLSKQISIESWLREQWSHTPPPIYSSVDLRNAGFKIAPVDTNLFPAGFNNLNHDSLPLCIQAVQATMERICPQATKLILIPEDHTRNIHYFENVFSLQQIFIKAGFETRIGSLLPELKNPKKIPLPSNKELLLEPVKRIGNRITIDDFSPSLILLNNDLSNGIPTILQNLEQFVQPHPLLGWYSRLKSTHFQHYENIANEFASIFNMDPWLISPLFRYCEDINFSEMGGENCIIKHSQTLLNRIQEKYHQHEITQPPFIVIKADAGTYGMAVMTIKDPEELRHLNRKERSRMSTIKGGREVTRVLIQEGVYTFETLGKEHAVAEPVVYMIGKHVVGGFYRVHASRGSNENLNAPGMNFKPLAFAQPCNLPGEQSDDCANRFYSYGVIARLALLAAAREQAEVEGKKS